MCSQWSSYWYGSIASDNGFATDGPQAIIQINYDLVYADINAVLGHEELIMHK